MNVSLLIVTFIGIGLIGYLIWLDNRNAHRQRLRAQKLYASPLYRELQPLLSSFRRCPFELLRVDQSGVYIRLVHPAGSEFRFVFAEHGYTNLTIENQEALLMLIEAYLPKLTDLNRYHLRKKRRKMLNGKYEYIFSYIIDIEYKIALNRAPYYDGTIQATPGELL